MNRGTSILLLVAMVGGLWAAGPLNHRLTDARRAYGITQADPLVNAPPLVVFTTVALGGFRGIIADLLWMRSARLQYEGRYFELVQLADWITKLEPRFTDVWAYHAWNLAYNISVLFTDHLDRWRWVRHGMTLLRDEGIAYNPGEPRLLYELGWIFQHKMGGNTDDAHLTYKRMWAEEMQALLGGERPAYRELAADPVRLQMMTRDYKLDPAVMQEIERRCGPIDWRLPQAHAIYWATMSKKVGRETDIVFAERMIYQAMVDAFRRGKLFTGADGSLFVPSPHLDLLPYVLKAYEEALANPSERGTAEAGYRFFLAEAVVVMYLYNRLPEARDLFDRLRQADPAIPADQEMLPFIFQSYTGRGLDMTQDEAYAAVESALYQSAFWQQLGDGERAAGYEQMAALIWKRFMEPRQDRPDFKLRTGLPPLEEIRTRARARLRESSGT